MMVRIVFFLLLAIAIYFAIVWARRNRGESKTTESARTNSRKFPVTMISCAHCGLHFPEDEAVLGDGKKFCSEKCRKAHRQN